MPKKKKELEDTAPVKVQRKKTRQLQLRAVLQFFVAMKRTKKKKFHAYELEDWVKQRVPQCTPGSPMRLARMLRKQDFIVFKCIDHPASLYRVDKIVIPKEFKQVVKSKKPITDPLFE